MREMKKKEENKEEKRRKIVGKGEDCRQAEGELYEDEEKSNQKLIL